MKDPVESRESQSLIKSFLFAIDSSVMGTLDSPLCVCRICQKWQFGVCVNWVLVSRRRSSEEAGGEGAAQAAWPAPAAVCSRSLLTSRCPWRQGGNAIRSCPHPCSQSRLLDIRNYITAERHNEELIWFDSAKGHCCAAHSASGSQTEGNSHWLITYRRLLRGGIHTICSLERNSNTLCCLSEAQRGIWRQLSLQSGPRIARLIRRMLEVGNTG